MMKSSTHSIKRPKYGEKGSIDPPCFLGVFLTLLFLLGVGGSKRGQQERLTLCKRSKINGLSVIIKMMVNVNKTTRSEVRVRGSSPLYRGADLLP